MQVINLRSRLIYRCNDNTLLKELYTFSLNYNEYLSKDIITLINSISVKEKLELTEAREVYRHVLEYTELMFERVNQHSYMHSSGNLNVSGNEGDHEQAYSYNDRLFNYKVNYFKMKRDLYIIYKNFFDFDNIFINEFIKNSNKLLRLMNGDYDDAQLLVDGDRMFK
jgi:hypothetical protein